MFWLSQEKTHTDVMDILKNDITGEFSWLDFKEIYKNDTEALIHDILCMSNARHAGTRYIIYGVENATWKLTGIEESLPSQDIYAILNSQIWNHKPEVLVDHVLLNELKFGYIAIANSPTKPHYLRKHYRKSIPAGAIYIRQGDTNTPYKFGSEAKSVEDGELETMFRERLGIDRPLSEKVEILLSQTDRWEIYTDKEHNGYYHQDFPEYQVRLYDSVLQDEESTEDWVELHYKQVDRIQKNSDYSRVSRERSRFGWGKEFSVYIHSTPVYQDGAVVRLYKTLCPYPPTVSSNDRYTIETNESDSRYCRLNYYVGAIAFLKNGRCINHTLEDDDIFQAYDREIENCIRRSRAETDKEPILVVAKRKL